MFKRLSLLLNIIAVICVFWAFVLRPSATTVPSARESAYARVLRTNILRCAYVVYPPEMIKAPNTGALTGTVVETTEEVARQLGLKVEWTMEVGFEDMFEGLKMGKYDALCSGAFETPERARAALFTVPINYGVSYAFVRADDPRFDRTLDAINDPRVKIAQIDGEAGQVIANENYSKARRYTLPAMGGDASQVLEAVATRKADVAFLQIAPGRAYIQSNPNKLRILKAMPARTFPAPLMAVAPEEEALKTLLDVSIRKLVENGFVERVLRKYDPALDSYLLPAKPYQITAARLIAE